MKSKKFRCAYCDRLTPGNGVMVPWYRTISRVLHTGGNWTGVKVCKNCYSCHIDWRVSLKKQVQAMEAK